MHHTLSRIDGLTTLYRKHHGSTITVAINDNESGIAHIRFEEISFDRQITWPEALRDYINLTDLVGRKYGNKIGPAGIVLTVIDDMRRKFEMKRHGGNQLTRCTDCFRSNNIETNSTIGIWVDFGESDGEKPVLHLSKSN